MLSTDARRLSSVAIRGGAWFWRGPLDAWATATGSESRRFRVALAARISAATPAAPPSARCAAGCEPPGPRQHLSAHELPTRRAAHWRPVRARPAQRAVAPRSPPTRDLSAAFQLLASRSRTRRRSAHTAGSVLGTDRTGRGPSTATSYVVRSPRPLFHRAQTAHWGERPRARLVFCHPAYTLPLTGSARIEGSSPGRDFSNGPRTASSFWLAPARPESLARVEDPPRGAQRNRGRCPSRRSKRSTTQMRNLVSRRRSRPTM